MLVKTGYLPRFHFSRKSFSFSHFWIFFSVFSFFFSFPFPLPIPSLHKSAGFRRPSGGSKRKQKRSYLKPEEGFEFSRRERAFSVEKRVCRKSKVAPNGTKPPVKAEYWTTQKAERRRRVEVGSGIRGGIKLQSLLFQSVDLDFILEAVEQTFVAYE